MFSPRPPAKVPPLQIDFISDASPIWVRLQNYANHNDPSFPLLWHNWSSAESQTLLQPPSGHLHHCPILRQDCQSFYVQSTYSLSIDSPSGINFRRQYSYSTWSKCLARWTVLSLTLVMDTETQLQTICNKHNRHLLPATASSFQPASCIIRRKLSYTSGQL